MANISSGMKCAICDCYLLKKKSTDCEIKVSIICPNCFRKIKRYEELIDLIVKSLADHPILILAANAIKKEFEEIKNGTE